MDIHLVCHRCIRKITSYEKCEHPSSGFTHDPAMDAVLSTARVECAHQGCRSLLPYYELNEHEITFRYAPCTCTETSRGFIAPPPALVTHLATVHSMQVHKIQYATNKAFQELVPLTCEASRRLILVGEQDNAVFVLMIGTLDMIPLVSVVCVRPGLCDLLVYRVRMWAEYPPLLMSAYGRRLTGTVSVDIEASSSAKPGDIVFEDLTSYLAAPTHYLVGPTMSKELHFFIRVEF